MLTKIYEFIKTFIVTNFKFILIIILINFLFLFELPYVIYAPGGAIDLSERIVVENGNKTDGKLQMAYVSMIKANIPFTLFSHLMPNWDLEKKSNITYENESLEDMMNRDRIYLQESIDNATIAAYKLTEHELTITKTINNIEYILPDAKTDLQVGDKLLEANGTKINSLDEYKTLIESLHEGDIVKLKVLRGDNEKDCQITVYEVDNVLKTGLLIINTYEYQTDPKIEISSKASESGPSGGLMLSLGIYNALTDSDITKGKNIIGTGTIDVNGNVGEIGGVKYKLIGAVNKKADIFICPETNYAEAIKVKNEKNYDIKIISAKTLQGVIEDLKNI